MSIREHLTETDERIPASALYTEHYYDSMIDPGDAQDAIDEAAWREGQALFDGTHEDDEDTTFDPDGPFYPEGVDYVND